MMEEMDHDQQTEQDVQDAVAVIGMAGRFPGAHNIYEFWKNLRDGVESLRTFTPEELQASGVDSEQLQDPDYVNRGGPLEDADNFDAAFFGFTPREAELMDPQHRVFLQCAYAAIQDAGYDPENCTSTVGVFGGVARNTYFLHNAHVYQGLMKQGALYDAMLGSEKDFPATRVSYKLNLKGPSINVQSACSTSGVAVHLACQSLLSGECDMALAGGARVRVPLHGGYVYIDGGIPSPDGHCRAFDADAKGCVYGSGVGIVVLKRLVDAIRDGDHVEAVILGSAVNNDGSAKIGFTAPSVEGQAAVIAEALAVADVDASSVSYVEAHGTGTTLGDPIEIAALTKAFRESTDRSGYCAIGSLKTNIGHLDAGAGVAGLIKTSLALKHKQIPASLNFKKPNPQIDFANSPFFVNDKLRDWETAGHPRRAGISSFGLGGTNFHAILEEAPDIEPSGPSRPYQLLTLSAKSRGALATATSALAAHLKDNPQQNLADVAYTLHKGRASMAYRRSWVCQDAGDAIIKLESTNGKEPEAVHSGDVTIAFMFPGQGAQHVNMGRDLYEQEKVFADEVDACCETLKPILGLDLRDLLYPDVADAESAGEQLKQTRYTQPALFVVEYALARLWQSWGVEPQVLIGHSIGEYVAAALAGVFSVSDALKLVAIRGRLMQQQPAGSMLAVQLSEDKVDSLMTGGIGLAASNAPELSVVSGPADDIDQLSEQLSDQGISARVLHTSHAFHSTMMEPVVEPFLAEVRDVRLNPPQIPFISGVTGTWITEAEAQDPKYWARQLREPVRFSRGITELQNEANRILLEVGPGKTLYTLAKQTRNTDVHSAAVVPSLRHVRETEPDLSCMLKALGELWMAGAEPDWSKLYENQRRQRVSLPTYPFERKRYWLRTIAQVDQATTLDANDGARPSAPSNTPTPPEQQASESFENAPAAKETVDRKSAVLEELKAILCELSGMDVAGIETSATFLEMGFDSLFLTRANVAFQKTFRVKITFRQLFEEAPTLDALAAYIDQELPPDAFAPAPPARQTNPTVHAVPTTVPPQSGDRKAIVLVELTSILQELSGIDTADIDPSATFLEMGFDSLFLTRANVAFQKKFAVKITFRQLFEEAPTLDALANYIDQELPPKAFAPVPKAAIDNSPAAGPPVDRAAAAPVTTPTDSAAPAADPASSELVERVLQQQFEIMRQQLDILRKNADPAGSGDIQEHARLLQQPMAGRAPVPSLPRCIDPSRLPDASDPSKQDRVQGFGPFRPVKKGPAGGLNPQQQEFLAEFIARYNRRTQKSKQLAQQHRAHMADPRTVSGFRIPWKECVYPIVAESSQGSRIRDVDGNEYVDIMMSFGSHLFGHSPAFIQSAIEDQLRRGMELGPQSPLAGPVADLFCELTGHDRMTYCQSGSEAVLGALRAARTVTGRDRIALFAGAYHGRVDCVVVRPTVVDGKRHSLPQVPGIPAHMVEDVIVLDYGDFDSLDIIRQFGDELAAVLVEPVQSRNPSLQPRDFLHALRDVTGELDIALIFDEIITGFRTHPGGAQAHFGVRADLATYGKTIAAGMPMAVVGGDREFMDVFDGGMWQFGDKSFPESSVTYLGGTFIRHPLALASAHATLQHIKQQGAGLQAGLADKTAWLAGELNSHFQRHDIPVQIEHFRSLFVIRCSPEFEYSALFFPLLRERGVHVYEDYPCFLSTAHTDTDLALVVDAMKSSLAELDDVGLLPRRSPEHARREATPEATPTQRETSNVQAVPPAGSAAGAGHMAAETAAAGRGPYLDLGSQADRLSQVESRLKSEVNIRGMDAWPGLEPMLDQLCASYLCEYFDSRGVDTRPGAVCGQEQLRQALGISPTFGKFFNYMLSILAQDDLIRVEGERITFLPERQSLERPDALDHRLAKQYPEFDGIREMLAHCVRHYGPALSGVIPAVSVLFPDGRRDLVDGNLKERTVEHRTMRVYQLLIRDLVLRLSAQRRLRILEVGAGSGALTWQVAPELRDRNAIYHVTDISRSFVRDAEREARRRGLEFMSFGVFDISHDPATQGLDGNQFDLILGLNVVHATPSLDDTLSHLKRLLAPGGVMCLVESVRASRWANLVWGLAEGWWCFDDRYRNDLALVDLSTWEAACWNQGFAAVRTLPADADQKLAAESGLVLAQKSATASAPVGSAASSAVISSGIPTAPSGARRMALTASQEEIWLASQLGPEASCAFNLCFRFDIHGALDPAALHAAIQRLIARHDALRLTFSTDGAFMSFADELKIDVPLLELPEAETQAFRDRLAGIFAKEVETPFDLTNGPLLRAQLIRGSDSHWLLVFTLHHLICDGFSIRTLIRDLGAIYASVVKGTPLEAGEAMQYSAYSEWQDAQRSQPEYAAAEAYYLRRFSDPPPFLELPTDHPRPLLKTFGCGERFRIFDKSLVDGLKHTAAREGCSMFSLLLATMNVLLYRLSGQDDLVLGVPAAGQSIVDHEELVGHCVNMHPFRSSVDGELPFSEFLKSVQSHVLDMYEHRNYTFGSLMDKLS
ncbi:MAG: aminotransferase class III-fold pyridoxal phosphate-dependent enzyme, partial [Planctomycetota bacterium]|nr:aminotransferase class III-fold pyridoxal phosphate-dependent enzyme [Planctomycetota bacterium]